MALVAIALFVSTAVPASPASAAVAGGDVLAFDAPDHGSTAGVHLNAPIVDLAANPSGDGYWQVASDGGVFAFGAAPYAGSLGDVPLNRPIVAMAPTPTGRGYWLVASDGGVFALGDALFVGSTGGDPPAAPVVDIEAAPSGTGYWLVTAGGQVLAFGTALHHGDLATSSPVVGIAATITADGYWLATADGGVYSFGNARFDGSLGGQHLVEPVVDIQAGPASGYRLATRDGGVFTFGGAPFRGSAAGACKDAVIGLAHARSGYWLGTTPLPPATVAPGAHPLAVIEAEHQQLTSLLRLRQGCQPPAAPRRGALGHPLPGGRLTSSYGWRTHPVYGARQHHNGTDFAGRPTALAAADGTVVAVSVRGGYGLSVVLDHGDGVGTVYSHLASSSVSAGQRVARGQALGAVGRSGSATAAHLHFEVRVHGTPTQPLDWL